MAGWTKAEYEGKVCWEQDGQRVFDTADIEKLEKSSGYYCGHTRTYNIGGSFAGILVIVLIIGILIGLLIAQ